MMTNVMQNRIKHATLMLAATVFTTVVTASPVWAQTMSAPSPAPKTRDAVAAIILSIIFILGVAAVSMKKSKRTHQD